MDWDLAIRRNRDQIRTIVLALFALAGGLTSPHSWGEVPGPAGRRGVFPIFPLLLPRSTIAAIMLVLRPAESAVRRLIVIVAQGLALKSSIRSDADFARLADLPPRGGSEGRARPVARPGRGGRAGRKSFPLFDPLKSFDPNSIWDADPSYQSGHNLTKSNPYPDASADQTPTDARHLALRLNAILRALNDLPRQARRLKRWELKRDLLLRSVMLRCERSEPRSTHPWRPVRFSPMRPGLPPGWRERKVHEIDDVLKECHRLALDRLNAPDGS